MKQSNCWSKTVVVLMMAACAVGGSLVNSSLSQNTQRTYVGTEVGRYQYYDGVIFDTKTAWLWRPQGDGKWHTQDAPWEANQRPQCKSQDLSRPVLAPYPTFEGSDQRSPEVWYPNSKH